MSGEDGARWGAGQEELRFAFRVGNAAQSLQRAPVKEGFAHLRFPPCTST